LSSKWRLITKAAACARSSSSGCPIPPSQVSQLW